MRMCQLEKTGEGRGGGLETCRLARRLGRGLWGGGAEDRQTAGPLGLPASESVPRCRRGWPVCEAAGPSAL